MKISSTLKYNIWSMRKGIIILYSILAGISIIMGILLSHIDEAGGSSIDTSSMVFCFVMGVVFYTEYFKMHIQNGISRRTMFISNMLTFVCLAAFTALVNTLFLTLSSHVSILKWQSSFLGAVYQDFLSGYGIIVQMLLLLLCNFGVGLILAVMGYFCGVLFARLSKVMRAIVLVTFGAVCFVGLPVLDTYVTKGAIGNSVLNFFKFIVGYDNGMNINYLTVSCIAMAAVLAVFIWLMLRRAVPKEK